MDDADVVGYFNTLKYLKYGEYNLDNWEKPDEGKRGLPDLSGKDANHKLVLLSNLSFGNKFQFTNLDYDGIENIKLIIKRCWIKCCEHYDK